MTLLYSHRAFLEHDTGRGHPESADRLRAIEAALGGGEFDALDRRNAPLADHDLLRLAHPQEHIDRVFSSLPQSDYAMLDMDTIVSPKSGEAALRAVGAVCAAIDAVADGEGKGAAKNAFCAVRPPGHHAQSNQSMGFCIFANVAIGALHGRKAHGFERVAVVDFDVHHGNGTQEIFARDKGLFYASTHQYPHYPGTGARDERGVGNIFNEPLAAGSGGAEFRGAMEGVILPALDDFAPDLILISAGFDAHKDDPLAALNLVEADYAWVTTKIMALADIHCNGRVVSALEGGYNLAALGRSVAAHVGALMVD